jgi:conjugative transposon protein traE
MKEIIKNLRKTIYKFLGSRGFQFAVLCVMALATGIRAYAAGNGMAGINEATSMVTSYFDPGTKLIYAIGAVVGLIGGIKVYSKWSSGDPDTSKTAASWFGACIFLIVAATILRSFFL